MVSGPVQLTSQQDTCITSENVENTFLYFFSLFFHFFVKKLKKRDPLLVELLFLTTITSKLQVKSIQQVLKAKKSTSHLNK